MQQKHGHMLYYSLLLFIFVSCFLLGLVYGMTKPAQMVLVLTGAFWYIALGVGHHFRSHDLSIKIVFEYLCFAGLGIGIMFFALGN